MGSAIPCHSHAMPNPCRLMFVVTEDWFFVSHFLSVAVAARDAGYAVSVVTRVRSAELQRRIEAAGLTLIPSRHERGTFGIRALLTHVGWFMALFRRERPDIVHLVSIRLIVLAGLGAALAGRNRRVHAVTGMGLLGASRTGRARAARRALAVVLKRLLGGRFVHTVFENREDPKMLGFDPDGLQVTIVGGAGVDPERESELPMPPPMPLRAAVVARMVRSKGIDVAVEAVRRARANGAAVELSLYGVPDLDNPRAISAADLQRWSDEPGIQWHGQSRDVRAVWRDHHVVCVPSRGGEGLPRSLLEGAAAGRAVLTTDTPGCATFVRDGIEGLLVPPDDPDALARAFVALSRDPAAVVRYGKAARARILDGFTTQAVARDFLAVYRTLVSP